MLRRTNSGQSIRSVAASPSMPRAAPVSEYAAQCGFDIGDRVLAGSGKAGICRFIGETEFAAGLWAGIELTSGVGKNDGSVQGKRYFECDQPKGLFILASKVTKAPTTGPSHFAVRHNKTSVLRQSGLQRSGSRESLASIGASSVASSRIFTPKIVRKPNVNLNIGNSYDKTIKTLQESLKEKENHIDRLLHEREADQVEIARLSGMKCMSPSSTTSSTSDERVKELEAEVSRLTNELLKKSAALEELTFTLEEERATTEARLAELESQLNELKSKESIEIDIPEASNEEIEELRNQIEQQKNEIESHINQMQSLGSDYAQAMEQCVLLEANLSDEANEKLKLIKRCETTEALRADLQAQLDGDTSQLVKEKDELQEAVDRLNSAVTQQDQAIQSERQQTKMLQELIEQQKNEIETHANRTQGLSSDYAEAMEKCVLLEAKLSDEANEKLELIKRCETSEALRAELQAQLDGDTSQLVKEKDEIQKAVDRLNSAVTQQDQVIQSERQQTKMLQELIEQQKDEIETHANRTQGLSSDYAKAMEKCVLLERKLSDEANEKLELIKRCETSEALRAELQAQLDGDTSRLVKEKDELQEAVDRLNSAITHRDQVIQSERQQTKMLQEFMRKMNEDIKKKEEESAIRMASLAVGSLDELKGQIEALSLEKAALKADLSQKIDLFLETDDMRERKEKENLSRIALLEKELLEAKMKKSDNEQILELENQVEFSKSIIATQQHKIEKLMEEISQINNALGQEGFEVQFEKKKKKREQKVVRKYCDICEQFDQHDTEDCPSQTLGPDEIQHHTRTSLDSDEGQKLKSKKGWIRKFCDHCDQFDLHDTEDCPNPQQF